MKANRARFFLKTERAVARLGKIFNLAESLCAAKDRSTSNTKGKIVGGKCYCTTTGDGRQSFPDHRCPRIDRADRACVGFRVNSKDWCKCGSLR